MRRWRSALQVPALARYKPWIDDLRKEKPYQLEEQLERLFHEKAHHRARRPGTACSARP